MSNAHNFKNSSSIRGCDYVDDTGHMIIHFLAGGSHKYKCPKSVYEGLKNAESPGKYFHASVRKQHKSEKI